MHVDYQEAVVVVVLVVETLFTKRTLLVKATIKKLSQVQKM
jgi:hypothetical protein